MTAAWVAGSTRARALVRRRAGPSLARRVAGCGSVAEAVAVLADTSYGHDVRRDQGLSAAQWAVLAALLWHLRVLAGWLPPEGGRMMRVLVRWFELANVDELMYRFTGRPGEPEFVLGSMDTAWSRLRRCASPAEIQTVLADSPWGDPGGDGHREIQLGMRLAWGARLLDAVPSAKTWILGAVALLVARVRHAEGLDLPPRVRDRCLPLLGADASGAPSITEMAGRLPSAARWALRDIADPRELWRGEERWWRRVEEEGLGLLAGSGFSSGPVLGAVAVLASDAWRVRGALESAARGGDAGHPAWIRPPGRGGDDLA
ncbi:hypothetical protein [Streptosporangium sp. NPDC051022]|uniref:hypothetical protein n=1 Tax=Streptosporangium sp. NPDC051022 TaxID=3155752 RepID=UPI00341AFF63